MREKGRRGVTRRRRLEMCVLRPVCVFMCGDDVCFGYVCVGSSNRGHVCAFSESGERSGRALRSASRAEMIYRVLSVCAIRVRAAAASILFVNTRRPRTAPRRHRDHPRPAIHSFAVPCQSTRLSLNHTYLRHTTLHRPRIIHISHRHVIIR